MTTCLLCNLPTTEATNLCDLCDLAVEDARGALKILRDRYNKRMVPTYVTFVSMALSVNAPALGAVLLPAFLIFAVSAARTGRQLTSVRRMVRHADAAIAKTRREQARAKGDKTPKPKPSPPASSKMSSAAT